MDKKTQKLILKELEARKRKAENAAEPFTLEKYCFDKQLQFINSASRKKIAVCSRRAGKTEACAANMVHSCLNNPRSTALYVTLSRTSAERIIWPSIINILHVYEIPHRVDNKQLVIKFDNGSFIYITGAKDKSEVEKFRGMSIKLAYVDEAQSFRDDILSYLIDDVITWATKDVSGTICVTGTPGPTPAGYFYKMSVNPKIASFHWTILDNPWIEKKSGRKVREILDEELAEKGITEIDPTYQREALGLWVKDDNALVFRFDTRLNIFKELPEKLNYIIGIDIGYEDADAIAVIGYSTKDPIVYLVEEYVAPKQNISSLINQIVRLQDKYKPIKIVMDAGALGKKIQDEIRTRHGIPVEAAHKERKLEFIELLNDDLRTGRFKTFEASIFEQDCYMVAWDYKNNVRIVSERTHSDIADSVLYSWKEAKHYIPKAESLPMPHRDTQAFMDIVEEKQAEAMQNKLLGHDDEWGVDDADLESIFDVYDSSGLDDY